MQTNLYRPEDKEQWDAFVRNAQNSTFLFERNFMDYHNDRFKDCSLIFHNHKGEVTGLLPANLREDEKRVDSHGGLTYGGLLTKKGVSLLNVKEMLQGAAQKYRELGADTLRYKPTPYIYHTYPAEEDLYWLFRAEARLLARTVSTTIDLREPLPFSTLRKRKVKKAVAQHFLIEEGGEEQWMAYWNILSDVLQQQHHTSPVHTLEEIRMLAGRFPQQIQLYTVKGFDQYLAGTVIFDCGEVIHAQYIASNDTGKAFGALDFLFSHIIEKYRLQGKHYFDFGISTEDGGNFLNEGLLFQKEGFGGRAVCYDTYEIQLEKLRLP